MNNIDKTMKYMIETFDNSEYYREHPEQKNYRIEHTIRVANIGKEIANKENMNEEALIIACLLHDISYANMSDNWNEHGRVSADIARNFLTDLNLPAEIIEDICYGIAIHVDGISNFKGKETILAGSVSDADNIDRFDVYRIYEGLQYHKFDLLSLQEKIDFVEKKIVSLQSYFKGFLSTVTATLLWREKINFQIKYFKLLKKQLGISSTIIE